MVKEGGVVKGQREGVNTSNISAEMVAIMTPHELHSTKFIPCQNKRDILRFTTTSLDDLILSLKK